MGFEQSEKKIYDIMREEGISLLWKSEDYISLFKRLDKLGFRWNPTSCKYDQYGPEGVSTSTPWCHVRPPAALKCMLDHTILFNEYDLISTRCLNCWKVVVQPRTFEELMALEKLQVQMDVPSKCGIEVRDYVPRFYGGYFYTQGSKNGLLRYQEVRGIVDEVISPDVPVILKRGCTEYEFIRGDSSKWNITEEQRALQNIIDTLVVVNNGLSGQHSFVKSHIYRKWMLWAHMNGDFSYLKYNNDKKLFPDYRQYQDMSAEEIKNLIIEEK